LAGGKEKEGDVSPTRNLLPRERGLLKIVKFTAGLRIKEKRGGDFSRKRKRKTTYRLPKKEN